MTISLTAAAARRVDGSGAPDPTIRFTSGELTYTYGDLQFCVINVVAPGSITPAASSITMPAFTGSTFGLQAEQSWGIFAQFGSGPRSFFTSFWYRLVLDEPEDSVVEFEVPADWITGPTAHGYRFNVSMLSLRADWGDIPGPALVSSLAWDDDDSSGPIYAPPMEFRERDVGYMYFYLRGSLDGTSVTGEELNGYNLAQLSGTGGGAGIGAQRAYRNFTTYLGYDYMTFGTNPSGQMVKGYVIRDSPIPGPLGGARRGLGLIRG